MSYKYDFEKCKEALKGSFGIKSTIAKRLGIERVTLDTYLRKYMEFKKLFDQEVEVSLDFAESKLLKCIDKEEFPAIAFLLKTKGKTRGYFEQKGIDITSQGDKIQIPTINYIIPKKNE